MRLRLVRPAAEHREAALEFRQEFFGNGETVINGSGMLDMIDSYDEWLDSVTAGACPETVSPDWVLTDTFFAVDGNGRIVGIIDLRHELKGFLTDFGNTGYSVRPSERGKGYAPEMLSLIAREAENAGMTSLQLSVERSNIPSVRTILKNGGRYERSFEYEGETADVYRIVFSGDNC